MLYYIVVFALLAVLLPLMGFGVLSGLLWEIAKILVVIFVISIIVKFIRDMVNYTKRPKL